MGGKGHKIRNDGRVCSPLFSDWSQLIDNQLIHQVDGDGRRGAGAGGDGGGLPRVRGEPSAQGQGDPPHEQVRALRDNPQRLDRSQSRPERIAPRGP
jgi:hypothetical protein